MKKHYLFVISIFIVFMVILYITRPFLFDSAENISNNNHNKNIKTATLIHSEPGRVGNNIYKKDKYINHASEELTFEKLKELSIEEYKLCYAPFSKIDTYHKPGYHDYTSKEQILKTISLLKNHRCQYINYNAIYEWSLDYFETAKTANEWLAKVDKIIWRDDLSIVMHFTSLFRQINNYDIPIEEKQRILELALGFLRDFMKKEFVFFDFVKVYSLIYSISENYVFPENLKIELKNILIKYDQIRTEKKKESELRLANLEYLVDKKKKIGPQTALLKEMSIEVFWEDLNAGNQFKQNHVVSFVKDVLRAEIKPKH